MHYPKATKYHAVVDVDGVSVEADFDDWRCPSDVLRELASATGAESGRDLLICIEAGALRSRPGLLGARILEEGAGCVPRKPVVSVGLDSRLV